MSWNHQLVTFCSHFIFGTQNSSWTRHTPHLLIPFPLDRPRQPLQPETAQWSSFTCPWYKVASASGKGLWPWERQVIPMTDPWDERYIYLHEWLKFMVFHVGKYTIFHGSYGIYDLLDESCPSTWHEHIFHHAEERRLWPPPPPPKKWRFLEDVFLLIMWWLFVKYLLCSPMFTRKSLEDELLLIFFCLKWWLQQHLI